MAGDWIKMRTDLQTHPKIVRIASALHADRLRAVGGLHAVWSLFDAHSTDGRLDGYTPAALDSLIGWDGFTEALAAVSWVEVGDGFLSLPRFDEHNGKSAKRRATETQRKREERAQPVRDPSASDADKKRSREEKRREEKENPPKPPKGGGTVPSGFSDFWLAWPPNERKQDKAKCLDHWKRNGLEAIAQTITADVRVKRGTQKWREGFIEAPLVYLRGRRWEDGVEPATGTPEEAVDWRATWKSIVAKGVEVGCGEWSESLWAAGKVPAFPSYKAQVEQRVAEIEGGGVDAAGQQRIADLLGGNKSSKQHEETEA